MSQLPTQMKGLVLTHHGDLDALSIRSDILYRFLAQLMLLLR